MRINLEKSWKEELKKEFKKDYLINLKSFLKDELSQGKIIYPHGKDIFSAFNLSPLEKTKVVIVGQDPYHGPNQAHGLSFSVRPGIKTPPSLQNIFKELHQDLNIPISRSGYLQSWASQGVLLLNNVLTVEKSKAAHHKGKGWEIFTDKVIEILNEKKDNLVFLLWGAHAQKKCIKIDRKRHLVLESAHPSPFSAHRGFFGQKHFSKTNMYLREHGIEPINWEIQ